ncbi:protein of unknown function DUF178 [Desulfovibrio sp. X2]|uniref:1,4-dihydroxy-6-naphthoate synthase n=1 Tax=Desulfovibrio sp. X2 TaxID=941449 RepID=UPI000358891B|nr:1,4-dihydroxy-6-naphthoate synthase [Desulfovibrio sp. X2]EPR43576.1 protein of unknown function DUF178 [Desulfovibrio sp. X2]
MRTLSLAISPCPNDTFIFHALVHGLTTADDPETPGEPLGFTTSLHDVERLNAMAANGEADVVKISVAAYADCAEEYVSLRCGGALGRGVGPLLVAGGAARPEDVSEAPIAIPGLSTTASLLLNLTGLFHGPRLPMRYDLVMDAVASGEVAAGVLIHEGRFTYAEHGLHKVVDLGAWWEQAFEVPLPLGLIVARRSLGAPTIAAVEKAVRASLAHARATPADSAAWIAHNAQELSKDVVRKHIETFVTEFSDDLGAEGERAVRVLLAEAFAQAGRAMPQAIFPA